MVPKWLVAYSMAEKCVNVAWTDGTLRGPSTATTSALTHQFPSVPKQAVGNKGNQSRFQQEEELSEWERGSAASTSKGSQSEG